MRSSTLVTGGIVGLIAGVIFAMWAMIVATAMGAGPFAPPEMIAAPLLGMPPMGTVDIATFVVGLIIHMMFSLAFGIIFAAIRQGIGQSGIVAIIGGMIYGLIVLVVMSFIVTPLVGSHIAQAMPLWTWVLAHLMFGFVLGLGPVLRRSDFVEPAKALS